MLENKIIFFILSILKGYSIYLSLPSLAYATSPSSYVAVLASGAILTSSTRRSTYTSLTFSFFIGVLF